MRLSDFTKKYDIVFHNEFNLRTVLTLFLYFQRLPIAMVPVSLRSHNINIPHLPTFNWAQNIKSVKISNNEYRLQNIYIYVVSNLCRLLALLLWPC